MKEEEEKERKRRKEERKSEEAKTEPEGIQFNIRQGPDRGRITQRKVHIGPRGAIVAPAAGCSAL